MKKLLARYLNSAWLPAIVYICLFVAYVIAVMSRWRPLEGVASLFLGGSGLAALGGITASVWNFVRRRWEVGVVNLFLICGSGVATFFALGFLMFASVVFGPSEDGFADNLTIPDDIEIANPDEEAIYTGDAIPLKASDELQDMVRRALSVPGNDKPEFAPNVPSLRKASMDHADVFEEYIEASPHWHVFIEQGYRYASRRWSYGGEPRQTLNGYISELSGNSGFQTRCLLCLDRKQWSRYTMQHVQEGKDPVKPHMTNGNNLHESRVMIECGGVWVEIFEQSGAPERRVTKATLAALEEEFAKFLKNPQDAVAAAQIGSRELAIRFAGQDSQPFRLLKGMQPGMYVVLYALNPGEPGSVYLKAFEVTQGTPLSAEDLAGASRTRMTWSAVPSDRFGAKAGLTIYEGDWGKPYAARFEVWFQPDSGNTERKLAERTFKIEGWQR